MLLFWVIPLYLHLTDIANISCPWVWTGQRGPESVALFGFLDYFEFKSFWIFLLCLNPSFCLLNIDHFFLSVLKCHEPVLNPQNHWLIQQRWISNMCPTLLLLKWVAWWLQAQVWNTEIRYKIQSVNLASHWRLYYSTLFTFRIIVEYKCFRYLLSICSGIFKICRN